MAVLAVMLSTYIMEVLGSNSGWATDNPERRFHDFAKSFQANFGVEPLLGHDKGHAVP
jgi:hypothetical protein